MYCFYQIQAKGTPVVEARTVGDDMRHWKGKIFGPVCNKFKNKQTAKKFIEIAYESSIYEFIQIIGY